MIDTDRCLSVSFWKEKGKEKEKEKEKGKEKDNILHPIAHSFPYCLFLIPSNLL